MDNNDAKSYTATVFIDETIAWIEANKSQAWVNWLALNAPHSPIHPFTHSHTARELHNEAPLELTHEFTDII